MYKRSLSLLAAFLLTGCATVLHGTRQSIEVSSEPPGATVTAGDLHAVTPGVIRLPRKARNVELKFTKEGYRDSVVTLARRVSGTLWVGLVGIPAGAAGGAALGSSGSNGLSVFDKAGTGAIVGGIVLPVVLFGVDLTTGAAYQLEPPRVHVQLQPIDAR